MDWNTLLLAVLVLNAVHSKWKDHKMAKSLQDVLDAVRAQNTRIEGVLVLVTSLKAALTSANQNTTSTTQMQEAIDGIFGELQKEIPALDMALTTDAAGNPAPAGEGAADPHSTVGSAQTEPVETDEERAAREAAAANANA